MGTIRLNRGLNAKYVPSMQPFSGATLASPKGLNRYDIVGSAGDTLNVPDAIAFPLDWDWRQRRSDPFFAWTHQPRSVEDLEADRQLAISRAPTEIQDQLAGASYWAGGTSFPTSPSSGDRFFRSDRALEYTYDGTRWLTSQLFTMHFGSQRGLQPYTTIPGTEMDAAPPSTTADLWLVDFLCTTFVATTSSATKYWTISVHSFDNSSYPALASVVTSADSPDLWYHHKTAINALADTTSSVVLFETEANLTSTPGALKYMPLVTYRLVG